MLSRVFLVADSSLSSPKMYHVIPFLLVEFVLRNHWITLWEFSCMLFVTFHLIHLIFYLFLILVSLITMCLSVFLNGLSCLGLYVLPGLG